MARVGRHLKAHGPFPPPSTSPGCSKPHPTWPGTLPGMGQPQLLWETCSEATPPSQRGISCQYSLLSSFLHLSKNSSVTWLYKAEYTRMEWFGLNGPQSHPVPPAARDRDTFLSSLVWDTSSSGLTSPTPVEVPVSCNSLCSMSKKEALRKQRPICGSGTRVVRM